MWPIKTLIFLAVIETWLCPGNIDDAEIRTLCPTGYRFLHVPRRHSRGEGAGLLFKHSLDLVISKTDDHLIIGIKIIDPVISDHRAVHCNLCVQKPHYMKKKAYSGKLPSLGTESFCEDILTSPLLRDQAVELSALVDQYDNLLQSPSRSLCPFKTVTPRPRAPWYKPEVGEQKTIRRWLERKWRSTRLLCDSEQYVHQCYVVNNSIESVKSSHYTINEHSSDQKILFRLNVIAKIN